MTGPHGTLQLPLSIRDREVSGDLQLQVIDSSPHGARNLLVLYGPQDTRPIAEFIVQACNTHDEFVELLSKYTHEGHLQTFEDRERFRKAARAILEKLQTEERG